MKIYDFKMAPNPRRVRIFLAEKGATQDVEWVTMDIAKGETRTAEFKQMNPYGGLPMLELDSGELITESMAICRYFEEIYPDNPLMGKDAAEKARIEMWNRRVEMYLYASIAGAFRHSNPMWAPVQKQVAEYAEVSAEQADKYLHMLDKCLAESEYVAGGTFSVADITALCAIDFAKVIKRRLDNELHPNLLRWHNQVSDRDSAQA